MVAAVLFYVLTTPHTPSQAAEQYIEDHYDYLAEVAAYAVFPDSALKAEIVAEVVESIAEQIIPYSCRAPEAEEAIELDARCNLSFRTDKPVNIEVVAPFVVGISRTRSDIFGRTISDATGADLITSELEVKGLGLDQLQRAMDAIDKVGDIMDGAGDTIDKAGDTIDKAGDTIDKAGDAVDQAGDGIKRLLDR